MSLAKVSSVRSPLVVASLRMIACGCLAVFALHSAARGQSADPDPWQPTVRPDRVVLTWSGDPATTQSVTWRTSTAVAAGVAEITIAEPGPNPEKTARRLTAVTEVLQTSASTAHCHSVTFTELTPATLYAYRVGDGTQWSEWFQFRTAAAEPLPFSFIYFGDAQNDLRSQWSRVIRGAWREAPKAAFMLHAGDLINRAENDQDWAEWFAAGGWINGMVPSIPAPGNHEQAKGDPDGPQLSRHWRRSFTLPENGPEKLQESCYTLVYQGLRIIVLNSNERQPEQAAWLDQVLSENREKWVICCFHHPLFSTGANRDNRSLRETWKPVLDKHRVDLVLQGHDHTYGRTGLETPSAGVNADTGAGVRDLFTGTVYVVSVSGPKMYRLQRHPFMKRQAEETQLYQIIHVNGDQLSFEAWTASGQLYDAFTLTKQSNAINQLEDRIPDVPERIRPPVAAELLKKASEALK
ncbi:MAG: Alkaline phosphatase precursor [Planctomycetota bacterium]